MYDNFLGIFNFRKDGVVDGVDAMLLSMNSALGGEGLALLFVGLIFKPPKVGSRWKQRRMDFAIFLLLGIVDTTRTCGSVGGILRRGD